MKRLWKNRGGFTLVEIIVTFTLTAIFMSSAAMVLSTFMRSHTVASAVATEQDVASIVMDTVTSNLSAARCWKSVFTRTDFKPEGETAPSAGDEECMLLDKDGAGNSIVWYVDGESGNVVKMYRQETDGQGYLAMDYFIQPEAGAEPTAIWTKSHWQLGTGVYQNCDIKTFKVSRIKDTSGGDTSCLSVTLTLRNKIAGDDHTFTMKRAIDCFNLAESNIKEL